MVIIKSKLTGKFLRHHSGSANNFSRRKHYQVMEDKEFTADLPDNPEGYNYWRDPPSKRQKAIRREAHNRMYDAEAIEARRFATARSAISSIGKWKLWSATEERPANNRFTGRSVLPEHLEIHEIVAGNLCLVNFDDSEETKRKKKKECE